MGGIAWTEWSLLARVFPLRLGRRRGGRGIAAVLTKESDVMWSGGGADRPSAITVTPPLFDRRISLVPGADGQDHGDHEG